MANDSSIAVAANVFTSPSDAFEAIRERPVVLLPVLVLLIGYCAVSFLYMNKVDLPWFMEQQFAASNAEITDAQREQATQQAANVSPNVYGAIGGATSSALVFFIMFLSALYYTGVSFVTHDGVRLKQWFALVCWCTLPTAFGLLAQIVNLSVADARFMLQDEINPLAFGNIFSIDREGATIAQRILLGIDLTSLWSIVLTVIGYQAWSKSSLAKATAVVLGPLIAIIAITTLFSML
jgi:Yip1 domain